MKKSHSMKMTACKIALKALYLLYINNELKGTRHALYEAHLQQEAKKMRNLELW